MNSKLLKELYSAYHKELYLYIYSLCKNHDLSEDLLQETFLKALLSLKENHTNIRAWLYMVARNLFFNYTTKEKNKTSLDEITNMPSADTDITEQIIANENRRACYHALQKLSRTKREVLILQYFGGLSQKEISAILHLTPENVRVLSFRGKKELKKILEVMNHDI